MPAKEDEVPEAGTTGLADALAPDRAAAAHRALPTTRVATGARVYLSPLDKAHIPIALAWLADPEVNAFLLTGHEPITVEQEEAWYDAMAASETDRVFEIHVLEDDTYIGNCGLRKIDGQHRGAELGIMIGSTPHHGRGYGRDATIALLRYA